VQESSQGLQGAEKRDTQKKDKEQLPRLRQPTLHQSRDKGMKVSRRRKRRGKRNLQRDHGWQGRREEDNRRYRDILKYCENRREEKRVLQEADKSRKEDAKRREEHWLLLRLCVKELMEGEQKWTARRIEECERINEERLAIVEFGSG
jgi:hypothetical protein